MNRTGPPSRIAHGYGNRRLLIDQALAGPVDYIEADIWYRAGRLWVRHERRLGLLPLLYDRRGTHPPPLGPLAIPIGPWYARLDIWPITLEELLEKAKGQRRLLLDLKGQYLPANEEAFANTLIQVLAQYGMQQAARVCGQNWPLLQRLRQLAPDLPIHYIIERPGQWQAFLHLLESDQLVTGVCLHHTLIEAEKARFLVEKDIEVFSWTIDHREEAQRLLALGVNGIISNRLPLLAELT